MLNVKKPRVLWIEDDLKYARLLELELGKRFDFDIHTDLSPALLNRLTTEANFDAVMIDMNLASGRQGPQALEMTRNQGFSGPIFVLSNDESTGSKLEMLSLGVDDYLWKVMPTEELALRLSNAIQRYQERFRTRTLPESLDGLVIHADRLTATLHGAALELSKIEFKIFLTLLRHHPDVTPVDTLKREVWEGATVENGTLSTFFWKLNKKTQGWSHRVVRSGESVSLKRDLEFNPMPGND